MNVNETTDRLKILVSAYACKPYVGSEEGTAWNAVLGLSKDHDLWVMVNKEFEASIRAYIEETPIPNVTWIFYDFTSLFAKDRQRMFIRRTHYFFWQQLGYFTARDLHREVGFDASIHITYGSYWRPSFLAYLPVPFVWGPLGGAENTPIRWLFNGSVGSNTIIWETSKILMELVGNTIDFSVRIAAHRSAVALSSTETTEKRLRALGAKDVRYVPQVRLPQKDIDLLTQLPRRQPSDTVRFFSSGRLIGWKGIQVVIHSFAKLLKEYPNAEYHHVGDGMLTEKLREMARDLGISDRFKVIEGKTRQENLEMMADSDVFVFPCLHNEPGWVVLEAMFIGLPMVFLRGAPRTPNVNAYCFTAKSGDLNKSIDEMAEAMIKLAKDPELRAKMGKLAREDAEKYLPFSQTILELDEVLREVAGKQDQ